MGGRGASSNGRFAPKTKDANGNYFVSACDKTIRADKQKQHILGTPEWTKASREEIAKGKNPKSALFKNVDPQKIVNTYSGKGTVEYTKRSQYPREYVDVGNNVGITYDKKRKKYVLTSRVQIEYSGKGVHVFPVLPIKKG